MSNYVFYNGDIAILAAIILIAGGILTGITLGLFSAIDLKYLPNSGSGI